MLKRYTIESSSRGTIQRPSENVQDWVDGNNVRMLEEAALELAEYVILVSGHWKDDEPVLSEAHLVIELLGDK